MIASLCMSPGSRPRPPTRTHPLEILALQATTRVPELVTIRYGRMAASPFAFTAAQPRSMAADRPTSRAPTSTCSCAATPTSPTSAGSPRPSGRWSSTSTTSTRPSPALRVGREEACRQPRSCGSGQASTPKFSRNPFVGVGQRLPDHDQRLRRYAFAQRLVPPPRRQPGDRQCGRAGRAQSSRTSSGASPKRRARIRSGSLASSPSGPPTGSGSSPTRRCRAGRGALQRGRGPMVSEWLRSDAPLSPHLPGDRRRLLESYRFVDLARKVVASVRSGPGLGCALRRARRRRPAGAPGKEAEASVLEPFLGRARINNNGAAGGRGPAPDAGCQRHLPRLARVDRLDGMATTSTRASCGTGSLADVDTMLPEGAPASTPGCAAGPLPGPRPLGRRHCDRRIPRGERSST